MSKRRTTRRRRLSAAVIAGLLGGAGALAPASMAVAAPEGRIQQVETAPGEVTFLFTTAGLEQGQTVDPASLEVTVDGNSLPATATFIGDAVAQEEAAARKAMLVLDTSGSMAADGKLEAAKEAARAYLSAVPGDVRVGLVTFADDATVAVQPTTDRGSVRSAIDGLSAQGATAMYDATALAVRTLGEEGSRSVVLLSDGEDEGSSTKPAAAAKAVSSSGVALDAVSLGEGEQATQLAALAKAGDGSMVTATDADAPARAFVAAARAVSSQLAVTVDVPGTMTAGTQPLTATVEVDGAPVTDRTVADVKLPDADPATFGPRAVEPVSGLWTTPMVVLAGLAAIFLALLVIGALVMNTVDPSRRQDGRIRRRLSGTGMAVGSTGRTSTAATTVLGDSSAVRGAVAMAEKVSHGSRADRVEARLQAAGVPLRTSEWVVVHSLVAVLSGMLFALVTGVSLGWGLLGLVLGAAAPWLVLGFKASRRRQRFYEQLPDTMQMLAGSLAAGYSLPQALDTVAREAGAPMSQEIQRALTESRLGISIEQALEDVATRMESKDFHWVVMAIAMNRQVGGNLADVLRTVAATLRERERLRRQVKALSAEGKLSAWVLGILPFAMVGYMMLVRPEYIGLLVTNVLGWVFIAMGVLAMTFGIFALGKIIKIEV
jgi:tight adherence protein B